MSFVTVQWFASVTSVAPFCGDITLALRGRQPNPTKQGSSSSGTAVRRLLFAIAELVTSGLSPGVDHPTGSYSSEPTPHHE